MSVGTGANGFLAVEETIECSWPSRGGGESGGEAGLTGRGSKGSGDKILSACSLIKSLSLAKKVLKNEGQCSLISPTSESSGGFKSLRRYGASSSR